MIIIFANKLTNKLLIYDVAIYTIRNNHMISFYIN